MKLTNEINKGTMIIASVKLKFYVKREKRNIPFG